MRGNVEEAVAGTKALLDQFNEISMKFAEPMDDDAMNKLMEKQAALQEKIDAAGAWELDRKLEIAADALRLPPWDADVTKLSGGERRRVALCQLLLSSPDMLLLDEPTNHLDAESVAWLERFLKDFPGTVVAVTHDRYFLDNAAEWILELDRGHGIPWKGNYSSWLEQKRNAWSRKRSRKPRVCAMKQELGMGAPEPQGRHAKSKARLQRYEEMAEQDFQTRNETKEIFIPAGPRLGDLVVEASGLSKSFGDRLLIDNLSFNLPRGGIVGIIGPNGAGKTTLFRMIIRPRETGRRRNAHRPERAACLCRSVARHAGRRQVRMAGDLRRPGHHAGRQGGGSITRLLRPLQLQRRGSAKAGERPVRRRTQSPASGQAPEERW